jgi:hypothetical protein
MLAVNSPTGKIKISSVEEELFTQRCFPNCLKFDACHDICCRHGCDVDRAEVGRILELKEELERLIRKI